MFDDPGRELRRLEQELLAAEAEELDNFEEYDEADDLLAEAKMLLGDYDDDPPIRNHANGYGRRMPNPAVDFSRTVYDDEDFDEDAAVLVEKTKTKGIGDLVFLAILEVIGILAIVGWWLQWLM